MTSIMSGIIYTLYIIYIYILHYIYNLYIMGDKIAPKIYKNTPKSPQTPKKPSQGREESPDVPQPIGTIGDL